ncbi:hypothetical protein [Streptacidiphilus sp. EB129]|uniref:COG4315 family predicted lipoprotein n=1 Tax=Streptacidiphilus sp. EB129 TaxID=3156262 RepID=UPI00351909D5
MKRVIVIALGAASVAALAAGCSSSGTTASSPPASSSAPAPASSAPASSPATSGGGGASAAGATVKAQNSSLGQILVDGSGRTLYLFTADTGSTSNCNGTCALAWPPDTTTGQPTANGLTASMVGTTMRTDHRTEVTYNGHPLYYFEHDSRPGDVNGEGVNAFGGSWYAVSPSGTAVTGSAPAAPAPAPSTPTPSPSSGGGYGGY